MSNKLSQSFENLLNILPSHFLGRVSPLSTKESQTLMQIWEINGNEHGHRLLPINSDFKIIEALIDKGLLANHMKRAVSLYPVGNYVEITPKGKNIIKTIILGNEKSIFDKKSNSKTASVHQCTNWLEKAIYGNNH